MTGEYGISLSALWSNPVNPVGKGATKICQRHGAPRRNTKASIGDSGYAAVRQARPCASGQAPAQSRAIAAPLRAYALLDTKSPRNDTKKGVLSPAKGFCFLSTISGTKFRDLSWGFCVRRGERRTTPGGALSADGEPVHQAAGKAAPRTVEDGLSPMSIFVFRP